MSLIQTHQAGVDRVRKLLEKASDEILSKSLRDCHAKGIDSIVLEDFNGALARLFIVHPDSELMGNPNLLKIGAHDHRYDLTLMSVRGIVRNVDLAVVSKPSLYSFSVHAYHCHPLGGGMDYVGEDEMEVVCSFPITEISMSRRVIHTVEVPRQSEPVCWLALELNKAIDGPTRLYTKEDMDQWRLDELPHLYKPMSAEEARATLKSVLEI